MSVIVEVADLIKLIRFPEPCLNIPLDCLQFAEAFALQEITLREPALARCSVLLFKLPLSEGVVHHVAERTDLFLQLGLNENSRRNEVIMEISV